MADADSGARRILSTDAINLKTKVKAEMIRRCYSGSVAAYGGTDYDFSTAPTSTGPLLGEHLKKNLVPMQAVNADGLPTYPGTLTQAQIRVMETKIAAWATRGIADRTATDCKNGCTGTCYSSCQTGCYSSCTSCTGCSGGCSGDCDGGCSGCGSGCSGSCRGCSGTCSGGCSGNCKGGCSGGCNDCSICTGSGWG